MRDVHNTSIPTEKIKIKLQKIMGSLMGHRMRRKRAIKQEGAFKAH